MDTNPIQGATRNTMRQYNYHRSQIASLALWIRLLYWLELCCDLFRVASREPPEEIPGYFFVECGLYCTAVIVPNSLHILEMTKKRQLFQEEMGPVPRLVNQDVVHRGLFGVRNIWIRMAI